MKVFAVRRSELIRSGLGIFSWSRSLDWGRFASKIKIDVPAAEVDDEDNFIFELLFVGKSKPALGIGLNVLFKFCTTFS